MSILQENVSLKKYNTFGIDVNASYFVEVKNGEDLREVFSNPIAKTKKLLVLGGGSNMLFTKDFDGVILKVSIQGITYQTQGDDVMVTAGGGVVWNDLVSYCVENNFAGIENLTLIPGTVGASPIQNIGAYGVELKDVFSSCMAFEIATGETRTFTYADCNFGYRDSVFKNELKNKYIITSVQFHLSKQAKLQTHYGAITAELEKRNITKPTIADISKVVADIRVSKLPDPKTIGNAGSFFKNPVIEKSVFDDLIKKFPEVVNYPAPNGKIKLAAGWLIEQCGFKGIVVGETGTWKNQALVLVNHGYASGQEVYIFSEQIINTVYTKFSVKLEREVNIL
ncbi:UDP-N-acetylmuramate dehydrogenase [Pedobacter sp. LMG 31464]|uniref:UDP-N-acetylenolpyruvoylglucosamine reductase n=1 Tax=Pedobacter planticolens TaxID=2679964 RepID=A0A923E3J7_9SPHI|nr:UDP-N-acetylmuramate dehydrogenase [Pedobacter planticolens]MBB2146782.1 UDP-N-acetylmuramate dehydrogenase [Pedobacter planticolens]